LAEPITPTAVVKDQYGRISIVIRRDKRPSAKWLTEQVHLPAAALSENTSWWAAAPLTGGVALVPEQCLTYIRAATYEDFITAVDHSTVGGRRVLADLFPQFAAIALEKLRGAQ